MTCALPPPKKKKPFTTTLRNSSTGQQDWPNLAFEGQGHTSLLMAE